MNAKNRIFLDNGVFSGQVDIVYDPENNSFSDSHL